MKWKTKNEDKSVIPWIATLMILCVITLSVAMYCVRTERRISFSVEKAINLINREDADGAMEQAKFLEAYDGSPRTEKAVQYIKYAAATIYEAQGNTEKALELYDELGYYHDSMNRRLNILVNEKLMGIEDP